MKVVGLAVLVLSLALLLQGAQAAITGFSIVPDQSDFSVGHQITGNAVITHSELLHKDTQVKAYLDGQEKGLKYIAPYINEAGYSFKEIPFFYKVFWKGKLAYRYYPTLSFNYTVTLNATAGYLGTLRNESVTAPETGYYTASVNRTDGLKAIFDGSYMIEDIPDINSSTIKWTVWDSHQNVTTVMRAACGNELYDYYWTGKNGWIRQTLYPVSWSGTSTKVGVIPVYFNITSLEESRYLFYDPAVGTPGGIYKDGQYQSRPTQVNWAYEYLSGKIIGVKVTIYGFNPNSNYTIAYFPPVGNRTCAYTNQTVDVYGDATNPGTETFTGTVKRNQPFTRIHTGSNTVFPPHPNCPQGSDPATCNWVDEGYFAGVTNDPSGTVANISSYSSGTLNATFKTSSGEFSSPQQTSIPLSMFPDLKAPTNTSYTIKLDLMLNSNVLATANTTLGTCTDQDQDGYCSNINDCNDGDARINPGAEEKCNSVDDDCDGLVDEDFWTAGTKLGSPCGVGICEGYYVCTPDGKDIMCSSQFSPGDVPEICDDGEDNDCDGEVDEAYEYSGTQVVPACVCRNGATKPCGSNVGECREGFRICTNHQWGECEDERGPEEEVCNGKDDDCNGVVDDIDGKGSVQATQCACFGGKPPSNEACNDLDDDCDGLIDEGISCCEPGQFRDCGRGQGACTPGTQACLEDGTWGPCQGGVQPIPEICYNNIDDDCDGTVDDPDLCKPDITCYNEVKDLNEDGIDCGGPCRRPCTLAETPTPYFIIAAVGVMIVMVVAVLGLIGKL